MPIESFRHKGLRDLYIRDVERGLPPKLVNRLRDLLAALDTAETLDDLRSFPGWRLHPLKGDLEGFWSLSVSGNWRLIFRFEDGNTFDLDLMDYH
jgi:toxin HigB-1